MAEPLATPSGATTPIAKNPAPTSANSLDLLISHPHVHGVMTAKREVLERTRSRTESILKYHSVRRCPERPSQRFVPTLAPPARPLWTPPDHWPASRDRVRTNQIGPRNGSLRGFVERKAPRAEPCGGSRASDVATRRAAHGLTSDGLGHCTLTRYRPGAPSRSVPHQHGQQYGDDSRMPV